MATFDFTHLAPVQVARVNAALDKVYRFSSGRVCSLRQYIEALPTVEREETDGMIDYRRATFNRLENGEQEAYMKRLRDRRLYWINDVKVPKIVYDVVRG
jgi:hypothetical protein